MNKLRSDSYQLHPGTTRYAGTDRYENPKEDFRFIAAKFGELVDIDRRLKLADVGCGNGEFLYYIRKLYPEWDLYGFDYTKEFIETARSFEGLSGVHLETRDFSDIEGSYDIVVCTCFLSLFQDITKPLAKLLDICTDGGLVFATGLFNPHDIEVRVEFCDNTSPETSGIWRTDFNRHSQKSIRDFLQDKAREVGFYECEYNIEIEKDNNKPIRVWTMQDSGNKTYLVNGAYQFANQTLMVIYK